MYLEKVMDYFENPRKNEQNLLAYLASKQVNNQLDEIYRATLYLGVQVGNAALNIWLTIQMITILTQIIFMGWDKVMAHLLFHNLDWGK